MIDAEKSNPNDPLPKKYFDLVEKVGSKGRYQTIIFLIFAFSWIQAGIYMLGQSVLFLEPELNCSGTKEQIIACQAKICSKPSLQWSSYLKQPLMESLATEFGPFLCEDRPYLNIRKMSFFLGNILGCVLVPTMSDNVGRKMTITFLLAIETIGYFLLLFSQSLDMASIALILIGFSSINIMSLTLAVFSETVDFQLQQKYAILVQIMFGIGGALAGVLGWAIRDWRAICLFAGTIPIILISLLFFYFFQETPKFLIKNHSPEKSAEIMNKIAHINSDNNEENPITIAYILSVKESEEESCDEDRQNLVTPMHLCIYPSLRKSAVVTCLLYITINYLFFGPLIIMDKLGLNPFLSQIVISSAEALAYYPSFLFINRLPRVAAGQVCTVICAIIYATLIIIRPQENCQCLEETVQIILIFIARFSTSFFLSILLLYTIEIFPLKVRMIGLGTASIFASFSSASGQYIFTSLEDRHFNSMIFLTLISLLELLILSFLADETLGKPLENDIQEIKAQKQFNEKFRDPGSGIQDNE